MKITCSKSNLVKGVSIVSKAVPSKTTMPILECILIDATTNEISSQTPFGIFPTKSAPLLFLPILKNLHLKFCL